MKRLYFKAGPELAKRVREIVDELTATFREATKLAKSIGAEAFTFSRWSSGFEIDGFTFKEPQDKKLWIESKETKGAWSPKRLRVHRELREKMDELKCDTYLQLRNAIGIKFRIYEGQGGMPVTASPGAIIVDGDVYIDVPAVHTKIKGAVRVSDIEYDEASLRLKKARKTKRPKGSPPRGIDAV